MMVLKFRGFLFPILTIIIGLIYGTLFKRLHPHGYTLLELAFFIISLLASIIILWFLSAKI